MSISKEGHLIFTNIDSNYKKRGKANGHCEHFYYRRNHSSIFILKKIISQKQGKPTGAVSTFTTEEAIQVSSF